MRSRIDEVPKLRSERTVIDANRFNQVRLALLRLGSPLRIPLTGLRGMDIIVDSKAWVCVDRTLYDLPVLAWTDFEYTERPGLHDPVACLLHYYHVHADLITETVLATLVQALSAQLAQGAVATSEPTALPVRKIH